LRNRQRRAYESRFDGRRKRGSRRNEKAVRKTANESSDEEDDASPSANVFKEGGGAPDPWNAVLGIEGDCKRHLENHDDSRCYLSSDQKAELRNAPDSAGRRTFIAEDATGLKRGGTRRERRLRKSREGNGACFRPDPYCHRRQRSKDDLSGMTRHKVTFGGSGWTGRRKRASGDLSSLSAKSRAREQEGGKIGVEGEGKGKFSSPTATSCRPTNMKRLEFSNPPRRNEKL